MILSFELTMPNIGSWNGQWNGSDKRYFKCRKVSQKVGEKFFKEKKIRNFYYSFGDGWGANIKVNEISISEKKQFEKISTGFLDYDWMIDSILTNGKILV